MTATEAKPETATVEQSIRLKELANEEARLQLEQNRLQATENFRVNILRLISFVFFLSVVVLIGHLSTHK